MQTETILKQIAQDVADIKRKVERIEESIEMREVKPEYLKRLKQIDEGEFLSEEEFEKELEL